MKHAWLLALLMVVVAGCAGAPDSGRGQCNQGLCVKIEVAEPVRREESVMIRITVMAEKDIPGLQVSLISYPPASIEDQGRWIEGGVRSDVNITAKQPLILERRVRIPSEGSLKLIAGVYTPNLPYISDSVRIHLTSEGAQVYYEGTPVPITLGPLPTLDPVQRATLEALPTSTPWVTPTLPPTPTHPRFPLTPTQEPYPPATALPRAPLAAPTEAAYP
jgi:hypothetical protein